MTRRRRRTVTVCTTPGCPELVPGGGRCPTCTREAEQRRGSAAARGYGHRHRTRFRDGVLEREPVCRVCGTAPSTVADHWPIDRRTLQLRGADPDDPIHGRGLCGPCHSRETARDQPGGWNMR